MIPAKYERHSKNVADNFEISVMSTMEKLTNGGLVTSTTTPGLSILPPMAPFTDMV